MGDLRTPRLNMRDQKLKMGEFRRLRRNMGDQKSPKLPLDLRVNDECTRWEGREVKITKGGGHHC